MQTLAIILTVLDLMVCVVLILLVMLQEGSNKGLGVISGTSSENDNFLGKNANKGRTKESRLRKLTSYTAIVFVALTIALYMMTGR